MNIEADGVYYYNQFKMGKEIYYLVIKDGYVVFCGAEKNFIITYKQKTIIRSKKELSPYIEQIEDYLLGKIKSFTFPVKITGSEFQKKVLRGALDINYGETLSYGQLAQKIGHPNAARAVGTVLKNNKITIIIPCHRIILGNGKLGNYNNGINSKRRLLKLEEEYK